MRDLDNVCLEVEHNWEKNYLKCVTGDSSNINISI